MKIWEVYPRLTKIVLEDHVKHGMRGTGHDFDHVLRAAQFAMLVAKSERVGFLAGAASLCHNADRIIQHEFGTGQKAEQAKVSQMVANWLSVESFTDAEKAVIIDAVHKHTEVNKADDSEVLITLKDADRLTCSMAEDVMGAAQFWKLPVVDPKYLVSDPESHSYKNPKSVLKNLECRYDWADEASLVCVRLPKSKILMKKLVEFIRNYIETVIEQRKEIGLVPYPQFK